MDCIVGGLALLPTFSSATFVHRVAIDGDHTPQQGVERRGRGQRAFSDDAGRGE
jgi:hypothetical protein